MEFDAKLTGFKELADALRELSPKVGRNVLRSAVAAGAAVVRVQARNNALAMKVTGTLARSIYQKQIRELSSATRQTFFVGARSGKRYQKVGKKGVNQDAYYARFVELGHFTRPRDKSSLTLKRDTARGGKHSSWLAEQVRSGNVRWVPAKPFLRPAFDVKQDAAVQAMGDKILQRLPALLAK